MSAAPRRPSRRRSAGAHRVPTWLLVAALVAVAGGFYALDRHGASRREVAPSAGVPPARRAAPDRARRAVAPPPDSVGPLLAIVIDDWGCCETEATRDLLAIEAPLTLAVIPGGPQSQRYAAEASPPALAALRALAAAADSAAAGAPPRAWPAVPPRRRDVILHLPMAADGRPVGEAAAGPDELLPGMPPAEVARRLAAALAGVPGASGVSNHRGSAATADSTLMDAFMTALAPRRLFFLDSLTTPRSAARPAAARHGVPYLANRLFLDEGDPGPPEIRRRLEQVAQDARRDGYAVGIGHPKRDTAAVLVEELPRLRAAGLRLVTLTELLALRGESRAVAGRAAGNGSR